MTSQPSIHKTLRLGLKPSLVDLTCQMFKTGLKVSVIMRGKCTQPGAQARMPLLFSSAYWLLTLTMKKRVYAISWYIGRERMHQSHGSGSFDRIVCGVQSNDRSRDPAWLMTLRPVGSYSVRWALGIAIILA